MSVSQMRNSEISFFVGVIPGLDRKDGTHRQLLTKRMMRVQGSPQCRRCGVLSPLYCRSGFVSEHAH